MFNLSSITATGRKDSLKSKQRARSGSLVRRKSLVTVDQHVRCVSDRAIPIIIVDDKDGECMADSLVENDGCVCKLPIDLPRSNAISSCVKSISKSESIEPHHLGTCNTVEVNSNNNAIETVNQESTNTRKLTSKRSRVEPALSSRENTFSAGATLNKQHGSFVLGSEHSISAKRSSAAGQSGSNCQTYLSKCAKMHDRLLRSTSHLDKLHLGRNGMLNDSRKLSLPHTLNNVGQFDKLPMKTAISTDDEEVGQPIDQSYDGIQADMWPEAERPSSEFRLRDQLFSFFQASDNKLAMKLFGSRNALLREKRRQIAAKSWLIHPCSNFRLYWDLLMLIFLITNLVVLPVSIAFFYDDVGVHWIVFNITCDTMFILDIIVNFRTGLIDPESHGDVILDSKVIALRYVKSWFVIDFISSLPLDYVFLSLEGQSYSAGRALRILRLAKLLQLLRLLRISRLVRYVRLWQEFFSLASIVVRIFNLICIMVLMGHWSGCIQFFVPVIQGWPDDSWISLNRLEKADWWEQYTRALFKALSHMLCIGYGQYPPRNMTDTWLTIASMLAGATCYALFIGHATTLIQSFDTSSRQFRDHLQQVNEYMIYRKLPTDLRRRITDYYEHRFGGKLFDEAAILSEISDSLRKDVIYHNCRELIMNVPFFVNADHSFVTDVITKLDFEMFQPGDIVIKADTKGDKMYFIQEGLVEILSAEGKVVTRLGDGSYFGEISLLTHQKRTATVQAATYCNLFSLSKEYFDRILECYPVMRRTLETIAAQRLQWLGKDPSMVTSRESLLDDIHGIQKVFKESGRIPDTDEESEAHEERLDVKDTNRQFLTVVKGFFTKDSDNFSPSTRALSHSGRISDVNNSNSNTVHLPRCKSAINHLLMVPNMTASAATRRVHSTVNMRDIIDHSKPKDDSLYANDQTPLMPRKHRHKSAQQLTRRKSPSPDRQSSSSDSECSHSLVNCSLLHTAHKPVRHSVSVTVTDDDCEESKPVKFVLMD